MTKDLLIEIGCEELPPKSLELLSNKFADAIINSFTRDKLAFTAHKSFATPRRLALIISNLAEQQADSEELKLGPAVDSAFDKTGAPTKAAEGFARSNGTTVDQLQRVETDKGLRLAYTSIIAGKPAETLIIQHIGDALAQLPIPKRMRWGSSHNEFVRPVKWVVLVLGETVIDTEILGVKSSHLSRGHRFHHPESFIVNASTYENLLFKNKVLANFEQRKTLIEKQVKQQATLINGTAHIDEDLLNEVTALVEWPVAITGNFESRFLTVPPEALISSMSSHQKYFHVLDANQQLLPHFITISNIDSNDVAQVIKGNERVIRPRLSDAAFFFETDKMKTLESRCNDLKTIVFQHDLGSLFDKTLRVSKLASYIASKIGSNSANAERAGLLSKSDLVSEMVSEFTDLQGLMGKYYALNDGEDEEIALALYEQYLPTGANSALPETLTGCALALAERIDTVVGIFGIGQQPTGNKDPFAIRRATLGILNIIISKSLNLDLADLYTRAFNEYQNNDIVLSNSTVNSSLDYSIDRLRAYYNDQNIATEVFLSVASLNIFNPLDFDRRVKAVHQFSQSSAADSLASANKRVANILMKNEVAKATAINHKLLIEAAEQALVLAFKNDKLVLRLNEQNYAEVLEELAKLKPEIDAFFDSVMVMSDDQLLRANRLAILLQLRSYFLQIADISLLVSK